MAIRECSIDGCNRPIRARGWCTKHYDRWRKNGDPMSTPRFRPVEVRIWERVEVRPTGCWEWQGVLNAGYGQLKVERRPIFVHRWMWEHLVGPIPEGLHIDHLCRNRRCCNPAHLEPVTQAENILRGASPAAENARKTHCKRGHPLNEENVRVYRGMRHCRPCSAERQRGYVEAKRCLSA